MKKIVLSFIILLCSLKAYAYENNDFQVWNTEVEEFKVTKNSKIIFEQEFRWGDNANEFFYQHYDVGFFYNFNKNINAGFGYRQVYDLKDGTFKPSEEPFWTLTFSDQLAGWKLDTRSRLEYRHFSYQTDAWRYRNKFTFKSPWEFTKLKIRPFISDEVFFNLTGIDFSQNRLYGGLGLALCKNFSGEIYYMRNNIKSPGTCVWRDANVFGTKLKVSF